MTLRLFGPVRFFQLGPDGKPLKIVFQRPARFKAGTLPTISLTANTWRFQQGLYEARRKLRSLFVPPMPDEILISSKGTFSGDGVNLRYYQRQEPRNRCTNCGSKIPPGRPGRKCKPCRDPEPHI